MSFLMSVVVFAAVILAFMVIERIYRSPSKPRWLDSESVVMPICVAFTGAMASSVGAVVGTALDLPLGLWGDVAAALLVIVGIVVLARIVFRTFAGRGRAPAA